MRAHPSQSEEREKESWLNSAEEETKKSFMRSDDAIYGKSFNVAAV